MQLVAGRVEHGLRRAERRRNRRAVSRPTPGMSSSRSQAASSWRSITPRLVRVRQPDPESR
jgi:hypothetical protein